MKPLEPNTERFRSATEFPRTLHGLESADAEKLYLEMRDCLIFTNRSRAQLIRHNNDYRDKVFQLKTDVTKLQASINALSVEKRDLVQSNQSVSAALQQEMDALTQHLDELSLVFDGVADLATGESQMTLLAYPQRFFRFLKAVRDIVLWWRSENDMPPSALSPISGVNNQVDLKENPQLGTDPASIGRSLLDNK